MVIFIGINDSKIFHFINRPLIDVEVFKESYAAFLKRADVPRKRKKILINLPPLLFDQIREGDYLKDFWYWDSKLYAKYNRAIRDLAKDHDCLVADIHSVFENENKVNLFNDDGVHPNIYGHQLIANEVLKALNHLSE
jgi:lysophospholipase L1-like esterase